MIGGDTSRADRVIVAVTGLGDLAGRAPVLRGGARAGDVVAVAGPLGHAAAGLALLGAGRRAPEELVAAQLRPQPPYQAGPEAAALGATAMIDVSDGLLADLGHIASASNVQVNVRTALLADPQLSAAADLLPAAADLLPAAADLLPAAADLLPAADRALTWILTGGEDHSLAATFPRETPLPAPWRPVGEILPAPLGHAVLVDGRPYTGITGWDHFR